VDLKKDAWSITKLLKGFEVSKINGQANVVAHGIAKFTRTDGVLLNSFLPSCVAYDVMNDCNNVLIN
jgi:hypothetical protein